MKIRNLVFPVLMSISLMTGCSTKKPVLVDTITLNQSSLTLDIGETFQLSYDISPNDAENKEIIWSVQDQTIASISNGLVTGASYGSTKVFCTSVDGNAVAECSVTVLDKNPAIAVDLTSEIEGINVTADKDSARPGETITVLLDSAPNGYEFSNIALKGSDGNPINIISSSDNPLVFAYIQPSDGKAVVTGKVVGRQIKAYIHDESGLLNKINMSTNDVDYEAVSKSGEDNGVPYFNLVYGNKARIDLKTNGYYVPTGIKLDGVQLNIDGNNQVFFDIKLNDNDDSDQFFFDIQVTFRNTQPLSGSIGFEKNISASLSVTFYNESKTRTLNGTNAHDVVYMEVTSRNPNVEAGNVSATYTYGTNKSTLKIERLGNGWFKFTAPDISSGMISFTILEADPNLLPNVGINEGKYLSIFVSPSSGKNTELLTGSLTVEGNGYLGFTSSQSTSFETFVNSVNDDYLVISGTKPNVPYGDGCMLLSVDTSNNKINGAAFETLDRFCFPLQNENDLVGQYTAYSEGFTSASNKYNITKIYRDGEVYKTLLVNYSNKTAYFGVDINMIAGEDISDAKAFYEISQGSDVILTIGYETDGGYNDRVVMGDFSGYYTGEVNDTLFIHGKSRASYNDEECTSRIEVIDETSAKVTLLSATHKRVLTLKKNSKTFSTVSSAEISSDLPAFAGKGFRTASAEISPTQNTSQADCDIYIEFSDTNYTFSFLIANGNKITLDNKQYVERIDSNVAYEFGSAGKNIISTYLIGLNGELEEIWMLYTSTTAGEVVKLPHKYCLLLFKDYRSSTKGITMKLVTE